MNDAISSPELKLCETMSAHTSWRVGGPADIFLRPDNIENLQHFLMELPLETPLVWVGLGSNLLVRDGGIRGAVICTGGLKREIERMDTVRVRVSAGLPCALLAHQCVRWRLGPAAFFAGIPGTIGGALAMNAGAFGGETWDQIESVETVDRGGERHKRLPSDFDLNYRTVHGASNEWFLSAVFCFGRDDETSMSDIRGITRFRAETQPIGQLSCGSVFKNPPNGFAAQLIEEAGLKMRCVGGAVVSERHANFIINTGTATAADIETLILQVREAVKDFHDVTLEMEVHVVGEYEVSRR